MTQIEELQGRITQALDRIAKQVDGWEPAAPVEKGELEEKLAGAEAARDQAQADATAAKAECGVAREAAEAEAEKLRLAQDEIARLTEQLGSVQEALEAAQQAADLAASEAAAAQEAAKMAQAQDGPDAETDTAVAAEPEAQPSQEDTAELVALREALEDEKMANAQLEERLRVLRARDADAAPAAAPAEQGADLTALDKELQHLRQVNASLEDSVAALREANAQGVGEPHLINKAMLSELESLRAGRAVDVAEMQTILGAMEPILAKAAATGEGG